MTRASFRTPQLHEWVQRMRQGDRAARDELLRGVCGRLERLARKMLRKFPNVRRWADTDDVLQNATLRLLRTLEQVQPASVRDFFGLAAVHLRRELLDLARHFFGPYGIAANQADHPPRADTPDRADDPRDMEQWYAFHEEVERLPEEEREVVSLIFYHGWTRAEVAEVLGVNEKTVRRRWKSALARLHEALREGDGEEG